MTKLLLFLILVSAVMLSGMVRGQAEARSEEPQEPASNATQKLLIVSIDFATFQCSLCLEEYLAFNTALESISRDTNVLPIGFFLPDTLIGKKRSILEKQVAGFSKSTGITYPVVVDSLGVFTPFAGVTVIDLVERSQQQWAFPLSASDLDELKRSLRTTGGRSDL